MKEEMSLANNVILFPSRDNLIPSTQLVKQEQLVDAERLKHIQSTINLLIPIIFTHFAVAGFTPKEDDEISVKEGAFIVEALRSYLHTQFGLTHPFQKIVKKVFVPGKDKEGKYFTIVKEFSVVLKE